MSGGSGGSPILETQEGGQARLYINKTGAPSIKGTAVVLGSTVDESIEIAPADSPMVIGFIYNNNIPDGGKVWVVGDGDAEVLLEDNTASTRGYWARTSITQGGRVDMTNPAPSGGTINEINAHFRETGHCEQSVTAGINKLARMHIHLL